VGRRRVGFGSVVSFCRRGVLLLLFWTLALMGDGLESVGPCT
jgi:hypothetical protein